MTRDKNIVIKNIFYMLSYAFQEIRKNNYENINSEKFEHIHDLFAEILIRGISNQLKRGIHKEYINKHKSLYTLRGKLDIYGTIQHRIKCTTKLDCEYDELSENNIYNQIIKTTLLVLIKQDDVKLKKKNSLKQLLLFFHDVNEIDIKKIKWNLLRYDRNTRTYQLLHYICYFIVENILMTTEKGKYPMMTFTDEHMNRLFEKFILEYYKKEFPQLKAEAKQINWAIDDTISTNELLPIMQTDIMLHFKNGKTLIIDAKYYGQTMQYHFNKATIHSHNLYQIHTYVINQDKNHEGNVDGMLLYAKTEEEITPNGQIHLNDGNVISFKTLDLNQDFHQIKKQLNSFISHYMVR